MADHPTPAKDYYLTTNGNFVIRNYQQKKTFASFLPGIAGTHGIPLWVFYVNRGQGIASFGVADKDHAIMEFEPANKAYQNVPTKGFRTFIKLADAQTPSLYEPFRRLQPGVNTKMIISLSALTLEEEATAPGLKTQVHYFILPEENFGALVRQVTIENLTPTPKTLELLDGMPVVVPYGFSNHALKEMSQTASAWARVHGIERKTAFYRTDASVTDSTEVAEVEAGNFFFSFISTEQGNKLLTPLVDPEIIFAEETSLDQPLGFLRRELAEYQGDQITENRYPCAMGALKCELGPGGKITLCSVFGYLPKMDLLPAVSEKFLAEGYLEQKQNRAEQLHYYYASHALTVCQDPRLAYYTQQTFVDNFLRGGFPLTLGAPGQESTYYVFSRKHGDLERDYNQYYLSPTFYSQGNGNFRDVLQNRRCDLFFNPKLKAANIKTFATLLQADGFNPLVVKGVKFELTDPTAKAELLQLLSTEDQAILEPVFNQPFTLGAVATFLMEKGIKLPVALPEFLGLLIKKAMCWTDADFGEGYWIDHWTYLLDLIETYLALYPEDRTELLLADHSYTFYDQYVRVLPRRQKYVLTAAGPRQTAGLAIDEEKKKLIGARRSFPLAVRVAKGHGAIYRTNLFVLLFTLVLNKLSSLDPHGVGIEMEAGKPGWYDALNGLPGLFGSSTPETMELLRLVRFLEEVLAGLSTSPGSTSIPPAVAVPTEVYTFYRGLDQILDTEPSPAEVTASTSSALSYWTTATALREQYRDEVFFGFAGSEEKISFPELQGFFRKAVHKLEKAVRKAQNEENGLFHTYFTNLPVTYRPTGEFSPDGLPYIEVTAFAQHPLPLFLEGQVRAMKILADQKAARALHRQVQSSELFDRPLAMYRVNADLSSEPFAIGRARAFAPGWLENGSIWLHMEYKYFLELLRAGLYEEFYAAAGTALIPYLDPEVYGRSILENSSFLLSSLNRDRQNHGRGYIARLSGSTVEFLSIWAFLSFGRQPFRLQEGKLIYIPQPVLRGDLFTEKPQEVIFQESPDHSRTVTIPAHAYAYRFLGKMLVVYHNPKRGNTFGPQQVKIDGFQLLTEEGKSIAIAGNFIPSPLAQEIRDGKVQQIDAFFA